MLFGPARFAALLALSTACFAAPSPEAGFQREVTLGKRAALTKPDSDEVDFATVRSNLDHLKNKYSSNMAAYQRNTGKPHPLKRNDMEDSSSDLERRDSAVKAKSKAKKVQKKAAASTGSVSLTDTQESLWHGAITYGGQTFQIDYDTGSADVIVNKNAYTPGSTAKDTGKTFSTAYGDGTKASGKVYTDNLSIGGLKASGVGIGRSNNNFIDTSSEGDSGIAGMSFPALAQTGTAPFFDALMSQGVVSKGIFTFKIATSGSYLYLGGIAPNTGSLTYVNVDSSQGFWGTAGSINGKSTAGIQDTGTTLIVAPTSYAQTLFRSISGVQTFTQDGTLYGAYNCNSAPTITIKIGSFSRKLSADTKSIGTTNDGRCVLSIVGEDIGINSVIYGDYWLRNVIAVFDRDNKRVGFAPQ